jgi:hypothetical protein
MKLTTIALATTFALSSTFALAQTTGVPSTGMSGTVTGSSVNTTGTTGATAPSRARNASGNTLTPNRSKRGNINSDGSRLWAPSVKKRASRDAGVPKRNAGKATAAADAADDLRKLTGLAMLTECSAGAGSFPFYALIEARGAYTPASAEIFDASRRPSPTVDAIDRLI